METPESNSSNGKSLIYVRCDYNKRPISPTPHVEHFNTMKPLTQTVPLLDYLKGEKVKLHNDIKFSGPHVVSVVDSKFVKKSNESSAQPPAMKRSVLIKRRPDKTNFCGYSSPMDEKFSLDKDSFSISNMKEAPLTDNGSDSLSDSNQGPLSPDSHKKELCTYLQLMNPAEKKEILMLTNRRSSRVRNLQDMQERKQLEKKIMVKDLVHDAKDVVKSKVVRPASAIKELSTKEANDIAMKELKAYKEALGYKKVPVVEEPQKRVMLQEFHFTKGFKPKPRKKVILLQKIPVSTLKDNYPTLKSFKELNIKLENIIGIVSSSENRTSGSDEDHFCFPFPPREMTDHREDFDTFMQKLIPSLRSSCRDKGLQSISTPKKKPLKNKENIRKKLKIRPDLSTKTEDDNRKAIQDAGKVERFRPNILRKSGNKTADMDNSSKSYAESADFKELKDIMEEEIGDIIPKMGKEQPKAEPVPEDKMLLQHEIKEEDVLEALVDDMVDLNNLSDEHKRCLLESRMLSLDPLKEEPDVPDLPPDDVNSSSMDGVSPLYGFTKVDALDAQKIYEEYEATLDEKRMHMVVNGCNFKEGAVAGSLLEHDYAGLPGAAPIDDESVEVDVLTVPCKNLPVDPTEVDTRRIIYPTVQPFIKPKETKTLHRSLQLNKRKNDNGCTDQGMAQEWDVGAAPKQKTKKQSHSINIKKEDGSILKAFYVDYNLVVCQESRVSFWMQTSLGHVLGSQNMWIPRGDCARISVNSDNYVQKESTEMVVSTETNVAYIELWTKEHKSKVRQGPVADVFANVYFWKQRQKGVEKKVLQLENINGFADDVQYSVMKVSPKIVVSWHSANDDNLPKTTSVHLYQLAVDYQTVSNIQTMEPVDHYVSSLHNIEDCDNLIMGCGENKITLWNVEHGYKIATVELTEIKTPLSTLWVKGDRGFLFALQQCVDRELRLVAINGINHSWKKLASYFPPDGFDKLKGVCIENGLLLSFYEKGVLCWNAETGEPVEEIPLETEVIPSGKHVIFLDDTQVIVKHVITHLMSMSSDDS